MLSEDSIASSPAQQSNWLTATFWLAVVVFFLMILGCTCRICPNCFPMIWKSISMCCTGYYYSLKACMQGCCKHKETAENPEAEAAKPFEIVHNAHATAGPHQAFN
jgi:hypothetical protein